MSKAGKLRVPEYLGHILKALGWQPVRDDLATIIEDAWKWECKVCPPSLVEPHQLRA